MNSRHGPNGHQREYAWTGNRTGARRLRALGDAPPAPTALRVAFYGRTNSDGAECAVAVPANTARAAASPRATPK